jgi:hypothetical protein
MQETIKQLNSVWYLIVALVGLVYGYAILNNQVQTIQANDLKQDIKIEKSDITFLEIKVELAKINSNLEYLKKK